MKFFAKVVKVSFVVFIGFSTKVNPQTANFDPIGQVTVFLNHFL